MLSLLWGEEPPSMDFGLRTADDDEAVLQRQKQASVVAVPFHSVPRWLASRTPSDVPAVLAELRRVAAADSTRVAAEAAAAASPELARAFRLGGACSVALVPERAHALPPPLARACAGDAARAALARWVHAAALAPGAVRAADALAAAESRELARLARLRDERAALARDGDARAAALARVAAAAEPKPPSAAAAAWADLLGRWSAALAAARALAPGEAVGPALDALLFQARAPPSVLEISVDGPGGAEALERSTLSLDLSVDAEDEKEEEALRVLADPEAREAVLCDADALLEFLRALDEARARGVHPLLGRAAALPAMLAAADELVAFLAGYAARFGDARSAIVADFAKAERALAAATADDLRAAAAALEAEQQACAARLAEAQERAGFLRDELRDVLRALSAALSAIADWPVEVQAP
jgi:hypothetical protein